MCLMYSKENYLGHIYLKLFIPKLIMICDSYKRSYSLTFEKLALVVHRTACSAGNNRFFGYFQFLVSWNGLFNYVTAAVAVARDATSPLNILFYFLEHGR